MHSLLFAAMILAPSEGWESKFFEDVRLHKGGPLVTIQVAWLEPEVVSTNSGMPAVVSVFKGKAGARELIKSTKIGDLGSYGPKEFYYDEDDGVGFLALPVRGLTRVFVFEDERPILVLSEYRINASKLSLGVVVRQAWAKDVEYPMSDDDHPYLLVERELSYDAGTKEFKPGPWQETLFMPVSAELRGANGNHSFVVKLERQYFKLGGREVAFDSDGRLTVDGLVAFGTDLATPEEIEYQIESQGHLRGLFYTELTSFRAWIDGKELSIPESLWKTCFNPNIGTDPDPAQYLFAWISADGTRLVVKMLGADAGGGYRVIWTLRPDGNHTRKVKAHC